LKNPRDEKLRDIFPLGEARRRSGAGSTTEEQRSQTEKGPQPAGSVHDATGEAADFPDKNIARFFIAGFFNSLLVVRQS